MLLASCITAHLCVHFALTVTALASGTSNQIYLQICWSLNKYTTSLMAFARVSTLSVASVTLFLGQNKPFNMAWVLLPSCSHCSQNCLKDMRSSAFFWAVVGFKGAFKSLVVISGWCHPFLVEDQGWCLLAPAKYSRRISKKEITGNRLTWQSSSDNVSLFCILYVA